MANAKRQRKQAKEHKKQERQFWRTVGIVTGSVLILLFIGFMNS